MTLGVHDNESEHDADQNDEHIKDDVVLPVDSSDGDWVDILLEGCEALLRDSM